MNNIRDKIEEIMGSETLSDEQKLDRLLSLRSDSRAAQRAATEGGMDAPDSLQTDLTHVDNALIKLGYEEQADENSAATL